MQRLLFYIVILSWTMSAWAQQDVKDEILRIKQDDSFVFGQATAQDEDQARQASLLELLAVARQNNVLVDSAALVTRAKVLHYQRGERICAFAFIASTDLPTQHQATPVSSQKVNPTPSPVQQKPTPPVQQPPTPPVQQPSVEVTDQVNKPSGSLAVNGIVAGILRITTMGDMFDYLRLLKEVDGTISDWGVHRQGEDFPAAAYLVVIGRDKQVKSILSPVNGSQRYNLQSGSPESVSDYHDCGYFWFKLN